MLEIDLLLRISLRKDAFVHICARLGLRSSCRLELIDVVVLLAEQIKSLNLVDKLLNLLLGSGDDHVTSIIVNEDGNPTDHFLIKGEFLFGLKIFIARKLQLSLSLPLLKLEFAPNTTPIGALVATLDCDPSLLSLKRYSLLEIRVGTLQLLQLESERLASAQMIDTSPEDGLCFRQILHLFLEEGGNFLVGIGRV